MARAVDRLLKQRAAQLLDRLAAAKAVKDLEGDPDSVLEVDDRTMDAAVDGAVTAWPLR